MKVITEALIERLAGTGAYQRGVDYFRTDTVGELDIQNNTILAEVQGGELYQVTLKHTAKIFEGFCDCPASEGFDFCKHCVAVSLEYLRTMQSQEYLQQSKEGDLIVNYLETMSKNMLVDVLTTLIHNDKQLLRTWKLHASVSAGKMGTAQIKKHITSSIPLNRSLHTYSEVRKYFASVEKALMEITQLVEKLPAEKIIALVDYAIGRVDKALETVDDSGGFRFETMEILAQLHKDTLQRCSWSAKKKADYLLDIHLGSLLDNYPSIPDEYVDVLGEEGLDAFTTSIQTRWDALPKLTSDSTWETEFYYGLLLSPLLGLARSEGDFETEISLLEKTATSTNDFIRLSKICLNNDLYDFAVQWHERAAQSDRAQFNPSSIDENQTLLWLYKKEYDKVFALLWQNFGKNPTMEIYQEIEKLSEHIGDTADNFSKAVELAQQQTASNNKFFAQRAKDVIAVLHLHTKRTEKALEIAEQWKLHPDILFDIIKANSHHVDRVLPLGFRLASFRVNQGENKYYKQAVSILKFLQSKTDDSHKLVFLHKLTALRTECKRKRNFCKFLDESGL